MAPPHLPFHSFHALIAAICVLTAYPVKGFDASAPHDPPTVADTPSAARTPDGQYISWAEHRIDDEDLSNGVRLRGGDGLVFADMNRDGILDVVSVHEDSDHLRIAFGTTDPDRWHLITVAEGERVDAIEDVAVGDLNNDGWPDLVAACEEAHLAYFQNPGKSARTAPWPHHIPKLTKGRGSWLRAFLADMTGDGRLEVLAANKGTADVVRIDAGDRANGPTSLFTIKGNPLTDEAWQEQVLFEQGVPNTALPVDVDQDGDMDVLAASRVAYRMFILENAGLGETGTLEVIPHPITLAPGADAPDGWIGQANAFQAVFAHMNGDNRPDLLVNVIERTKDGNPRHFRAGLAWLEQPPSLSEPWRVHRIGAILPDWVIGIAVADIDGDGDTDAIVGGYSGLNILAGGYSGASRQEDDPSVTAASSVGRIAWFENPGRGAGPWTRHDVSRRVRGMYDAFIPHDLDKDSDVDFIATRGNSGAFDGVFWLEQVRSAEPLAAFTPARAVESRALPLPPPNWQALYDTRATSIAPE